MASKIKLLIICLFLFNLKEGFTQYVVSYDSFKSSYTPHNILSNPEDNRIKELNTFTIYKIGTQFNIAISNINNPFYRRIFINDITSLPREKVGKVLDMMPTKDQINALNLLLDTWALDIIYYVSESTYNQISYKINALKNYKMEKDYNIRQLITTYNSAKEYFSKGNELVKNIKYDEANQMFTKSISLFKKSPLVTKYQLSEMLNSIAGLNASIYNYKLAITLYEQSIEIAQETQLNEQLVEALLGISDIYQALGYYDKAIQYTNRAFKIDKQKGYLERFSKYYFNLGTICENWGKYKKAVKYYENAIRIDNKLGKEYNIPSFYQSIGMVYRIWGKYDKAFEYCSKALDIVEKSGKEGTKAVIFQNIGITYYSSKQFQKAEKYYKKALDIYQKNDFSDKGRMSILLSNFGELYRLNSQFDEALKFLKIALKIEQELGREKDIAFNLIKIATVYNNLDQFDLSELYSKQAFEFFKKQRHKEGMSLSLMYLGMATWNKKNYSEAVSHISSSVKIREELRKSATGSIRRNYFASIIELYQMLISMYIDSNQSSKAFNTTEISSAKYLSEQLFHGTKENEFTSIDINTYKKNIAPKTVIIKFTNINSVESGRLVVDQDNVYSVKVSNKLLLSEFDRKFANKTNNTSENLRGKVIMLKPTQNSYNIIEEKSRLDEVIYSYRTLLTNPNKTFENNATLKYISKKLFTFLFKDIESYLVDKNEIIILPDGILAYLPFETLIMPDGKYLCEKYVIRYTQSLTISKTIATRNYLPNRKELLAVGGGLYDVKKSDFDMIKTQGQLLGLKKQIIYETQSSRNLTLSYGKLGYANWTNLPGTLAEVNAIHRLIQSSKLLTGSEASEQIIKEMSDTGKLANYKILHFATHGIVIPEVPDLSALVLSLNDTTNEDGYLTMNEIVKLKIKADFVNLSACKTGLGKILAGEGVVGLTQAFLIAGANNLSVSLWHVNDESTKEFMIAMYQSVIDDNKSYYEAINGIKRKFIIGDFGEQYKHPYYWAPFVYYGK